MIFAPFDFETTGLPFHPNAELRDQPRAIEFACLLTDGEKVIDSYEFLCNPHKPLEAIINRITGLKDEDLLDEPDFVAFVPQIRDYFGRADAIISHNLTFDKFIMSSELRRVGMTLRDVNWPAIEICTVEQTFHQYGRNMKLTELYNELVGEYVQKHRAIDDVKQLNELCLTLGVYNVFSAA